ncbi:MAG: phosphatase PAP2 family protein [Thermodesulfobacteriota bacterium]
MIVGQVFLAGYLGIPRLLGDAPGISLALPFERHVPYAGWAALPYTLGYPFALSPALFFSELNFFRRGALALLATMAVCFAFFLLLPVRCVPPPVEGGLDALLLPRLPWLQDGGWNAFPSLHVATATLALLSLLRVSRLVGVVATLLWLAIVVSTLLLKRHYLVDLPAGAAIGALAHFALVEPELGRCGIGWAR